MIPDDQVTPEQQREEDTIFAVFVTACVMAVAVWTLIAISDKPARAEDATNQDIVDAINALDVANPWWETEQGHSPIAAGLWSIWWDPNRYPSGGDAVGYPFMGDKLNEYDSATGSVFKDRDTVTGDGSIAGGASVFKELTSASPNGADSVFRDKDGRSYFREAPGSVASGFAGDKSVFTDDQGVSWLRRMVEGDDLSLATDQAGDGKSSAQSHGSGGQSNLETRGTAFSEFATKWASVTATDLPDPFRSVGATAHTVAGVTFSMPAFGIADGWSFSKYLTQHKWVIQFAFYTLLFLAFVPHWFRLILSWDTGAVE